MDIRVSPAPDGRWPAACIDRRHNFGWLLHPLGSPRNSTEPDCDPEQTYRWMRLGRPLHMREYDAMRLYLHIVPFPEPGQEPEPYRILSDEELRIARWGPATE